MNKYVGIYILSLNLQFTITLRHEKPIAKTIWQEDCVKGSSILNDCNWCRCNNNRYTCDARVCNEVDMFGHFNDAIRDLNVGMEGHGVWRTGQSACTPGIKYQRDQLLCICTEDGSWPNPVCRDTFRILHPVEIVTDVKTFKDQQCAPAKLYLIGCNVCFCPADGVPNPKFCTRESCSKDDPVYDTPKYERDAIEVYAECDLDIKYKLGCKNCVCLRNNRLICDNCTDVSVTTQCNKNPGESFNIDCNICKCNGNGSIYCTVRKCITDNVRSKDLIDATELRSVDPPVNDIDCVQGTRYERDCNTCFCFMREGTKKFGCTVNKCSKDEHLKDCVVESVYKANCLICQCDIYDGNKMEICYKDPKCKIPEDKQLRDVEELHGYCEPLHKYKKGCNICECLPDGKTVKCSTNNCPMDSRSLPTDIIIKHDPIMKAQYRIPIKVEVVPVVKDIGHCSKGSVFKIDCNVCYCLSNGDILCTTDNCRKKSY